MPQAPGAVEGREACLPRRRARKRTVIGVVLLAVGWLIVAVLALGALLRLVAWIRLSHWWCSMLLLWSSPAGWVVAASALIARRWWLGVAAAVVVAAQLVFVMPELAAATPLPTWAQRAPAVRVFDANIDSSQDFYAGYVQGIEQDRPDLVTLEEFTPSALNAMSVSGVLARFPYRCAAPVYGAAGFMVASRLRLTGCRVETVSWNGESVPYMVEATFWSPAGPVALRVVHTLAPFPAYWRKWSAALAAVDQSVHASDDARMLMIGDFNATWDDAGFATLLANGLTDGAAARGKAIDMTWPNGAIVLPFVRIDHMLTGTRLAVTQIATEPGFGSDHRYLTATVAIQT